MCSKIMVLIWLTPTSRRTISKMCSLSSGLKHSLFATSMVASILLIDRDDVSQELVSAALGHGHLEATLSDDGAVYLEETPAAPQGCRVLPRGQHHHRRMDGLKE